MKLHSARYGAEILLTLSKHAGYIQKNVLLASDYTYKVATFVSGLQSTAESDGDFGGFQAFPGEKKEFEVFDGEFVSTVITSFLAGRVLEISDSPLGGGQENYLKKVDVGAALKFLSKSKKDDVYSLFPGSDQVSVASVYYGSKAWALFSAHEKAPATATPAKSEAIVPFLKSLFKDGGFRHSTDNDQADLQSTYQAIFLLKSLNLWDSFASNRKDVEEKIHKFVLSHRDASTKAFGEVPGAEPDVANTFWAVAIAKELGLEHVVDTPAVTEFVTSLQSYTDGGFKLNHQTNGGGHHSNTYYALETLEALGRVAVLEEMLAHPDRVVLAPQFIHNAAFVAMAVLVLVGFAGTLYLLPRAEEETDEDADKAESDKKKEKKMAKKKKKEPTMTIIRNRETKECVDKDGVPFPIDSLNKKEWDIVDTKESDTHTIYVLRKKDISLKQKLKDSPLKARRLKKK